jgi:26S proteasome regulatory subunit N1
MQILGMAALACGMVAVGTGNAKVVSAILTCLVEKSEADLKDAFAKFLALGLGITYLGRVCLVYYSA